jgi:protein-S-isoprenylcysteine O-methyltransferase Ste14
MKLKIPPPVYMLIFATFMWLLSQYYPLYKLSFNTQYLGITIVLLGLTIDLSSLIRFLLNKTTVNPMKPENSQILVTTGMYQFSRNPMYLGLLLLLTGWSLYIGAVSAILMLPLFVWVLTKMQIQPEEIILEELFGQPYIDYQYRVRRWI